MSDWGPTAVTRATPTHINSLSRWAAGGRSRAGPNMAGPVSTTWTANLAIFIPLRLPWPYVVQRFFWLNGSVVTTSTVDCAIYSVDGTLIIGTGSVTQTPVSAIQYQAPTAVTVLPPGRYYLACCYSGTTNRGGASALVAADGEALGLQQQATAMPLPATMTAAVYAGAGMPYCGITKTASGF